MAKILHANAEITLKSVALSLILVALLATANAYLALKAGLTISASIPAAIISLAILSRFKGSTRFESNIVQTAASTGEALAAGMAFTLPAFMILGLWGEFDTYHSMMLSWVGGMLGVLFVVPLRKLILADTRLIFPEGRVIGNILKGEADAGSLVEMIQASLLAAMISFLQLGWQVAAEYYAVWFKFGSTITGISLGFSPALLGAGYIIGMRVAVSLLVGLCLGWIIGVPVFILLNQVGLQQDAALIAQEVWQANIRCMGVGVLFVGGFATIIALLAPAVKDVCLLKKKQNKTLSPRRRSLSAEADLSFRVLVFLFILCLAIISYYFYQIESALLHYGQPLIFLAIFLLSVMFVICFGYIATAICGYIAGLIGSSLNPVSSISIMIIIVSAVFLFPFQAVLNSNDWLIVIVMSMTTIATCSAAIAGDTMQDLKAGQMIGATPWVMQLMMVIGVSVAALLIPQVLNVLFKAYGVAGTASAIGKDSASVLAAPQAGLIAMLAKGVFTGELHWSMVSIGVIMGCVCLGIEKKLLAIESNWQLSTVAVGMGIYLPFATTTALIIGAYFNVVIGRKLAVCSNGFKQAAEQRAMMYASGLIAGSAVMGLVLAVPFIAYGNTDILRIIPAGYEFLTQIAGCLSVMVIFYGMYRAVDRKKV